MTCPLPFIILARYNFVWELRGGCKRDGDWLVQLPFSVRTGQLHRLLWGRVCPVLLWTGLLWVSSHHSMLTSSNGNIFRVTGPLCTETSDAELWCFCIHLRLNKRLSKQPWGWWFETPPWSLWRQCNDLGTNIWYGYTYTFHLPCLFLL